MPPHQQRGSAVDIAKPLVPALPRLSRGWLLQGNVAAMARADLDELWRDPSHWRWFGYVCAEDPRPVVAKRGRIGWTMNWAHPRVVRELLVEGALVTVPPSVMVLLTIWLAGMDVMWLVPGVVAIAVGQAGSIMLLVRRCRRLAAPANDAGRRGGGDA